MREAGTRRVREIGTGGGWREGATESTANLV